jgi:hypothetical protein
MIVIRDRHSRGRTLLDEAGVVIDMVRRGGLPSVDLR